MHEMCVCTCMKYACLHACNMRFLDIDDIGANFIDCRERIAKHFLKNNTKLIKSLNSYILSFSIRARIGNRIFKVGPDIKP
jgi:hypothetical protein